MFLAVTLFSLKRLSAVDAPRGRIKPAQNSRYGPFHRKNALNMNTTRNHAPILGLATLAAFALALPAGAQQTVSPFTIILDNPTQIIQPGQTASFSGTVTNTGTVAQPADPNTFLGYALGYPNNSGFSGAFATLPISYAPGESYTGPLFFDFQLNKYTLRHLHIPQRFYVLFNRRAGERGYQLHNDSRL